MGGRIRNGVRMLLGASPLLLLAACQVVIGRPAADCDDGTCEPGAAVVPFHEPRLCKDPSMHAIASDLDHLEKHIDWFGSVTAKTPDVWGQARLTQYREDFEKEMYKELGAFNAGIQGSLKRTDQAFFSSSLALAMAAQPKPPVIGTVNAKSPGLVPISRETVATQGVTDSTGDKDKKGTTTTDNQTTTTKEGQPTPTPPPTPIPLPALADLNKEMTELKNAVNRNDAKLLTLTQSKQFDAGIGIEPTLLLAQKKRYLDFLNQLRRENEGDDTADSTGYSLNLIRVPVSVLPGTHTDKGHGAEVTMTLTPVLGDDLLPMTFRTFVINDLADQLGFPLAAFLEQERLATKEKDRFLTENVQLFLQYLEAQNLSTVGRSPTLGPPPTILPGQATERQMSYQAPALPVVQPAASSPSSKKQSMAAMGAKKFGVDVSKLSADSAPPTTPNASAVFSPSQKEAKELVRRDAEKRVVIPRLSFASGLNQRQAFPTSQLYDVFGIRFSFEIAYGAQLAFREEIANTGYAHVPNVQAYLREELLTAYQFLARPENQDLWTCFCTEEIVSLIRSQQWDKLLDKRREYRDQVMALTGSKPLTLKPVKDDAGNHLLDENGKPAYEPNDVSETRQVSRTSALAWCILVDAALLTDRLIKDMKQTATSKGKYTPDCETWRDYYHPNPSPEAGQAFKDYVNLRWPVRVFALDPATQDQNVTDTYSSRREMQLALAIAFTNGVINANSMTKYARRLELEAETIALNRPQIGFGHGENTFGWRFNPRFQTPDTRSNLTVFVRDQLIGGPNRNQLLRERRLEPGMRECVAVVMMPSFVPYVQLDTTSNWFALANPKHKKLDHTQALHLSRTVQTIKTEACSVKDAQKYREGEYDRLRKRAEQLEARLPTQTIIAQVPVLNTLSGFEMFSNGTTNLTPELYGWYGAPGIDPEAENTTLFLHGELFSPLRTRVIVGNQEIDLSKQKMLSRQVMQITVPKGSYVVKGPDGPKVRIHLATPHGVTQELAVPAVSKTKKPEAAGPKPGYSIPDGTALTVRYGMDGRATPPGYFLPAFQGVRQQDLTFQWDDPLGVAPKEVHLTFVFTVRGAKLSVPCVCKPIRGAVDGLKQVVLDTATVKAVGCELLRLIRLQGAISTADNPLAAELVADKVYVTPVAPDGHTATRVEASGKFKVTFQAEGLCPPDPKDDCDCPPAPAMMDPPPASAKPTPPAEQKKDDPAASAGVPVIKLKGLEEILQSDPLPAALPPAPGGK